MGSGRPVSAARGARRAGARRGRVPWGARAARAIGVRGAGPHGPAPAPGVLEDGRVRAVQTLLDGLSAEGRHAGRVSGRAGRLQRGSGDSRCAGRSRRSRRRAFADVFEAVAAGRADRGVVPVENSQAGTINETYDLLLAHELVIGGELDLRVSHCLMALPGQTLAGDPAGVLAPAGAGAVRALPPGAWRGVGRVLRHRRQRQDDPRGAAPRRGRGRVPPRGRDLRPGRSWRRRSRRTRTTTRASWRSARPRRRGPRGARRRSCSSCRTGPRALYRVLGALAARQINMTKIESRPRRIGSWEYVFYMDFDGHADDPDVRAAIDEMRAHLDAARARVVPARVRRPRLRDRPCARDRGSCRSATAGLVVEFGGRRDLRRRQRRGARAPGGARARAPAGRPRDGADVPLAARRLRSRCVGRVRAAGLGHARSSAHADAAHRRRGRRDRDPDRATAGPTAPISRAWPRRSGCRSRRWSRSTRDRVPGVHDRVLPGVPVHGHAAARAAGAPPAVAADARAGALGRAGGDADRACTRPRRPGGWRLLGRTPLRIYDPARSRSVPAGSRRPRALRRDLGRASTSAGRPVGRVGAAARSRRRAPTWSSSTAGC